MNTKSLAAFAAAVIGGLGMATSAGAATDIFMSGSSAARNIIGQTALPTCDTTQTVTHYQSVNGNLHLYQCTFAGNLVNFHYSARGSADGVYPVDDTTGGDVSKGKYLGKGFFGYIDESNPANSGCGVAAATAITFWDPAANAGAGGNVTLSAASNLYKENKTCTNPPSAVTTDWPDAATTTPGYIRRSADFGASDVAFSSFGQSSPAGTEPANPAPNVTENLAFVLPFNIVVQNNVRRVDSSGNDLGPLTNVTSGEVEKILSRNARDWRQLGAGVTAAVNPPLTSGQAMDSSVAGNAIRLCLREFGSGTKAAVNKIFMHSATEVSTNSANVTFYSASSSGVRDCMNDVVGTGFKGKVGYLDANETTASPSWVTTPVANVLTGGHPVTVDGYITVDATATTRNDSFKQLRCGKPQYWTVERLYNKTAGTGNATKDSFISTFITNAQDKNVIENIPLNWGYEATQELLVSKSVDAGPTTQLPFNATTYAQCEGL